MTINRYIDIVFQNTNEKHEKLKLELLDNYLEELEDMMTKGMHKKEAEDTILDRLGPVYDFRQSLGIQQRSKEKKFYISFSLLTFHFFLNSFAFLYAISFYFLGINFSHPFQGIGINYGIMILYITVATGFNLINIYLKLSVTNYSSRKSIKIYFAISDVLTFPFSVFGILLKTIYKEKHIIDFFKSKSILSSNRLKKVLHVMRWFGSFLFILFIALFIISKLRQEIEVNEQTVIDYVYSDSTRGINIYTSITVTSVDDNSVELEIISSEYFHSSNYINEEDLYTKIIFGDITFQFDENEMIVGEKNTYMATIVLDRSLEVILTNIDVSHTICIDPQCETIIEIFYKDVEDATITNVNDVKTVWLWNIE